MLIWILILFWAVLVCFIGYTRLKWKNRIYPDIHDEKYIKSVMQELPANYILEISDLSNVS